MFSYIFTNIHTLYSGGVGQSFGNITTHLTSWVFVLPKTGVGVSLFWEDECESRWMWHLHFSSWDLSSPARVGVGGHAETNHCTTCGWALAVIRTAVVHLCMGVPCCVIGLTSVCPAVALLGEEAEWPECL